MQSLQLHSEGYIAYQVAPQSYTGGQSFDYHYSRDIMNDIYLKGKKDGANDMQIELMKRGKALFELALKKAGFITKELIQAATDKKITIYDFYLKLENWDSIKSLILVDMDDFIDEKIEFLYKTASEISDNINDEDFHWDFSITYFSENINIDKIRSDGFTHIYEHISKSRQTQ